MNTTTTAAAPADLAREMARCGFAPGWPRWVPEWVRAIDRSTAAEYMCPDCGADGCACAPTHYSIVAAGPSAATIL
jgi:hypothetical protein